MNTPEAVRAKKAGGGGRAKKRSDTTKQVAADEGAAGGSEGASLGIRVKERDLEERPKSRLGSLFSKDSRPFTPSSLRIDTKQDLKEIKETLTRPLSSLFRRPTSSAGRAAASSSQKSGPSQASQASQLGPITLLESDSGSGAQASLVDRSQYQTDLSEQAAIAPHINVNKVSTIYPSTEPAYYINNINLGRAGDIDVSFLSRFLCPEDEITDENIPWNWEYVFASVSGELRDEWALEEENTASSVAAAATDDRPANAHRPPNGL